MADPMNEGVQVEAGAIARFGQAVGNAIAGWFSPGSPLPPVAPPDTTPRVFDFPYGVNMNTTRPGEPIPWKTLREFSRNYPLIRVAIERMKDRIVTKRWIIKLDRLPGESSQDHAARVAADPRIPEVTKFLQKPDLESSWRKWSRKLLNDLLVIDAACIVKERKKNGKIYRCLAVDGSTITRLIDIQGMTPRTPDPATGKLPPAYQQRVKGLPAIDLTVEDLQYCAENIETDRIYGYSRVEQVLQWALLGLNRLIHQSNYYTEGSVPDVFGFLPEGTSVEEAQKWDAEFQKKISGKSEQKRKIWWMPWTGKEPVQMKASDLTDKMDEMLNRFILFAFGISPSPLVPQVNRATAQQNADDADESGETPICAWLAGEMNELIQSEEGFGYEDLSFAFEDQPEVDQLVQAQIDQIYLETKCTVPSEVRERNGKAPFTEAQIQELLELQPGFPEPDTTEEGDGDNEPDPGDKGKGDNEPPEDDGSGEGKGKGGVKPPAPPKKARAALVHKAAQEKPTASTLAARKKELRIDPAATSAAKTKARDAIAAVLKPMLTEQAKILAKQIGLEYSRQKKKITGSKRKAAKLTEEQIQSIADKITDSLSFSSWGEVVPAVKGSLQAAAMDGSTMAGLALDLDDPDIFSQSNEWAISYAEDRAAELVGMKYVDGELVPNPSAKWAITDTTREQLNEQIVSALEDGSTIAELKQSIIDSQAFSAARAEMIATTEVNFANSGGQFDVGKLVGHTFKRSVLSGDHDIDDECDENADATDEETGAAGVGIEEVFPSGDLYSPFHPNCVCLTVTYTPGEEL